MVRFKALVRHSGLREIALHRNCEKATKTEQMDALVSCFLTHFEHHAYLADRFIDSFDVIGITVAYAGVLEF